MATKRTTDIRLSVAPTNSTLNIDAPLKQVQQRAEAFHRDLDQHFITYHQSQTLRNETLRITENKCWDNLGPQKTAQHALQQSRVEEPEVHQKNLRFLEVAKNNLKHKRFDLAEDVKTLKQQMQKLDIQEQALSGIVGIMDEIYSIKARLALLPDIAQVENGTTADHMMLREKRSELKSLGQTYGSSGGDPELVSRVLTIADGKLSDENLRADLLCLRDKERLRSTHAMVSGFAKWTLDETKLPNRIAGTVYHDVEKTRPAAKFDLDTSKYSEVFINHHLWGLLTQAVTGPAK
eukprot:comp18280_c0_seq1/m.19299 comp18280_c0_seq1/g.19299  ORF comp18280_c0_seq1/g.19299 comp18280_c0_seq1/m.19299 type:complete len:293 (-) comp18280_c0_seq1:23-901(-)